MIRVSFIIGILSLTLLSSTASLGSDFAKSQATYRHAVGLRGLDQNADPTWNPTYLHALALAPHFALSKLVTLSAEMELIGDFTQTDWTTDPVYWSDLTLALAASELLKLHDDATTLGASFGLRLPTSHVSQAHTLVMAPSLTGYATHRVAAVAGLEFGLELGVFRPIHQNTTGELEQNPIQNCRTAICQSLSQIPTRNIRWGARQMLTAQWAIQPWVTATVFAGGTQSKLHEKQSSADVSFQIKDPREWRYEFSSGALLSHPVFQGGIISYGIASTHPLFKDNGHQRYTPLVNRNTVGFLELRLSLGEFVNEKI